MASLGLGLLLIGLGFKVAAVPFHMWAPDVYDGSPTPVTGFMATGVKAAAFAALVRVLLEAFPSATSVWQPIIAALAIASMVVGNLVALSQRSLKRMLAYSSIAHAGYLLVAVWAGTPPGAGAVLLYLLAYALTTLASFGFVAVLGRGGERDLTLRRSRRTRPPPGPASRWAQHLHALAAGFSRDLRLHRQVVHHHGDGGGGAVHPSGHPGADQRDLGGLLPAGDHGDVHEAGARAAGYARASGSPRRRPAPSRSPWRW